MIDQFIRNNRIQQMLMGLGNQQSINPSTSLPPVMGNPVDPSQLTPPPMPFDENARMKELFTPETTMNNRFRGLIDQMPQREKPGFWRGLGSVIVGAGSNDPQSAMINSERFAQMPYYRKLEDWEAQIKPVQQAADNERADNTQRRMAAQSILSNEARQRQLDITEEKNTKAAELARERENRIAKHERDRIAIAQYLKDNPTMQKQIGKDGYLYLVNPRTGESMKTDVLTGELSEIQKMEMGLANALTRIRTQGEVTKDVQATAEATRQQNRLALIKARTEEWNLLPAQKRQLIQHNAEQLIRSNPALEQYISLDPNTGMVFVEPESEGEQPNMFGIGGKPAFSAKDRQMIIDALNKGLDTPRRSTTTTSETPIKPGTKVGENDDKRSEAIKILEQNKKPVTEANIAYILKQLGAR